MQLSSNEQLDLPRVYELGFEAEASEEGYFATQEYAIDKDGVKTDEKIPNSGENGGGMFYTGSVNTSSVQQKSGFSYCWYKKLKDSSANGLYVPIVTDHEAWDSNSIYDDMKDKRYFGLRQRFWYRSPQRRMVNIAGKNVRLVQVVNSYTDNNTMLELDYKDTPHSIARNYFLLLDNSLCYTLVECYLTAEEYRTIFESLVEFNGDLYIAAEVDGYDPQGLRPAKLKLIKRW